MSEAPLTAVRAWLGDAGRDVDALHVPDLDTPAYACVVLTGPGSAAASSRYVMVGAPGVLRPGPETFARVLQDEGVMSDPERLPASLVATLYCRLAGVDCIVLTDPAHWLLGQAARFHPPSLRTDGAGGIVCRWWGYEEAMRLHRYELAVEPTGAIALRTDGGPWISESGRPRSPG